MKFQTKHSYGKKTRKKRNNGVSLGRPQRKTENIIENEVCYD